MGLRRIAAWLVLAAASSGCTSVRATPPLERGAVAAPERMAAEIGDAVLRDGGNAVDAAVAVGFALAATFPTAGNLGGGGFLIVRMGDEVVAVDCRETAPAAATRDLFLDDAGDVVPGRSLHTHLAAGVPGTVAGLWEAHQRWGTRPWLELVEPAVHLAEVTFQPSPRESEIWGRVAVRTTTHPSFAQTFWVPAPGEHFTQPELAATLRRIADRGRDGFYRGETARLIAAEMRRGGGLITEADLAAYEARVRRPVEGWFRGHRVVSMPPPSSGGAILVMMLSMLEELERDGRFDASRHVPGSGTYEHLVAEIETRVFADRAEHFGDPDRVSVPLAGLLDRGYLRARLRDIDGERRTLPASVSAGAPALRIESEETTHYSVVDRHGNAVSHTTTLNAGFGSTIVVEGAGFLLNNEMDDFAAKPGVPNLYGATGGDANAVGPGKRMLSSMSPTLVFDEQDRLVLVLGSPGGTTIFTTIFQVLMNRLVFGMTLEEAVEAPRFHHQWPPRPGRGDVVRTERGHRALAPAASAHLVGLGYALPTPRGSIGEVHAVEIDPERGTVITVDDTRGRLVPASPR